VNWHKFYGNSVKNSMSDPKEFERNKPADKGRNNDPYSREESAQQPGVNTYSSSENDDANQHLTKTASENFREESFGENADEDFDSIPPREGVI
jgi:hypothetical protein